MQFLNQINPNTLLSFGLQLVSYLVVFKIILKIVLSRLNKLSKLTSNSIDDILIDSLEQIHNTQLVALAFLIPLVNTVGHVQVLLAAKAALILVVASVLRKILLVIVTGVSSAYIKENPGTKTIINALKMLVSIVIYLLATIFILDIFGVNINTLIAGLGIGGIAAALAIQNILADIFSAVTLYIDRPFNVGDYISFGKTKGTIQKIGLKSTTLSTLAGTEVIISNKDLTSQQIENFGRMKERTVSTMLTVAYGTSQKKLELVKKIVTKAVEANKAELLICSLSELGESSLNYKLRYKVHTADYQLYLATNEAILSEILSEFEKNKIEIPFPSRTVYNK